MTKVKFYAKNFQLFLIVVILLTTSLLILKNNLVALIDANGLREVVGVAHISTISALRDGKSQLEKLVFTINDKNYDYPGWFPDLGDSTRLEGQKLLLIYGPANNWVYSISQGSNTIIETESVKQSIRSNNQINLPIAGVFLVIAIILAAKLKSRKESEESAQEFTDEVIKVIKSKDS